MKTSSTVLPCSLRVLLWAQLLIVQVHVTSSAGQQELIQVVQDHNDTRCNISKCYTLTELIQNQVGGSNMKISFLPGVHVPNVHGQYRVSGVTNFSLVAADIEKGATILCNYSIGFHFSSVTNLEICGLTFEKCRHLAIVLLSLYSSFASVHIRYSENVSISYVNIRNGTGIGLFVISPRGTFIVSRTTFRYNDQNFCVRYIEKPGIGNGNDNVTIANFTNLTVTNSEFSHGMTTYNHRRVDAFPGISIHLSETMYRTVVQLTNITTTENYFSNWHVELQLCKTTLNAENVFSSQSENGLSLIVSKCESSTDSVVTGSARVHVKNATFLNAKISVNDDDLLPSTFNAQTVEAMHKIVFTNITVRGIPLGIEKKTFIIYPNEFYNAWIEMQNATFEESEGIFSQNARFVIKDHFIFKRNNVGLVTTSSNCPNSENQMRIVLRKGSRTIFQDNNLITSRYDSVLYATNTLISMNGYSQLIFENNSGVICGGMLLVNSNFSFSSFGAKYIQFSHNRGRTGGALALFQGAHLKFDCKKVTMRFTNNAASEVGGAIYVDDLGYIVLESRLSPFYIVPRYCRKRPVFYGYFNNNTARVAGNIIYGGWLDGYETSDPFSSLDNDREHPSEVSSDPIRVCICEQSTPNCNLTMKEMQVIPGETLIVQAVAVGQRNGIVPSLVKAQFKNTDHDERGYLDETQYTQNVNWQCTNLTFTLHSSAKVETIDLLNTVRDIQVKTSRGHVTWNPISLSEQFKFTFYFRDCPLGFYFENVLKICSCHPMLLEHGIHCAANTFHVLRSTPKWINATFEHTIALGHHYHGIIVHNHCPFHYCELSVEQPLRLETPDDQCAFNRSGILCGACQTNFSHVLGTSRCMRCPKPWIALILPSMTLAGMILVAFLIVLNLTVSTGSISGLIFYANIVRVNSAVFFPPGVRETSLSSLSSFLSTFIAWMNLDLGIEACFYDGLTAYAKTWFQFLFPLYIWCLVILIIVASHYSSTASRLSGNNAVQVLATLFLLSYAKLLRLIITIFSSTELVYPDGYIRKVWLYDGNVDYLKGKHIPLFVAALFLLIFVSAPYTAVLLFIQWLQKWSFLKVFFWVRKLHPLFDAYTGPYKVKHRYWTGLLLLVRVCLFLVFSLNSLGDPTINFLAVVAMTFCLLTYVSFTGGIYKLWFHNVLENAFILNLGLLSAAVGFYQNNTATVVPAITCTSVGISFLLFAVIVFVHMECKIMKSRIGRALKDFWKRKMFKNGSEEVLQFEPQQTSKKTIVTQSTVDLNDLIQPIMSS